MCVNYLRGAFIFTEKKKSVKIKISKSIQNNSPVMIPQIDKVQTITYVHKQLCNVVHNYGTMTALALLRESSVEGLGGSVLCGIMLTKYWSGCFSVVPELYHASCIGPPHPYGAQMYKIYPTLQLKFFIYLKGTLLGFTKLLIVSVFTISY